MSSMNRTRVAAAIDVGYGHTKWACRVSGSADQPIAQGSFPSMAVAASTADDLMRSMQGEQRDQVTLIQVGGKQST